MSVGVLLTCDALAHLDLFVFYLNSGVAASSESLDGLCVLDLDLLFLTVELVSLNARCSATSFSHNKIANFLEVIYCNILN